MLIKSVGFAFNIDNAPD